jgi:hypothetical protein
VPRCRPIRWSRSRTKPGSARPSCGSTPIATHGSTSPRA